MLGSFLWGWLGDRIGRRASILYAGIGFIGTSICGAMPSFAWNLVMCFVMGLAVGGMLPICYALLAETIPARHRSWLMILVGADIAGAYIITSWLAAALVPDVQLAHPLADRAADRRAVHPAQPLDPRVAALPARQRRDEEARAVMKRYGAVIVPQRTRSSRSSRRSKSRWSQLLRGELLG